MSHPTDEVTAYKALDDAIEALSRFSDPDGEDGDLAVDAVLIVGFQKYDDEGNRVSTTAIYPRNGGQPCYITMGLLHMALLRIAEDRAQTAAEE